LTALLTMLVLTMFVVTPLASSAIIGSEITLCFVAVLTITGVAAVSGRRAVLVIVVCLAVFACRAPSRTGLMRYFSFVTLTTLGYGDILPVSPIARSLATSEALFGEKSPHH
jgi:hypothetical protein